MTNVWTVDGHGSSSGSGSDRKPKDAKKTSSIAQASQSSSRYDQNSTSSSNTSIFNSSPKVSAWWNNHMYYVLTVETFSSCSVQCEATEGRCIIPNFQHWIWTNSRWEGHPTTASLSQTVLWWVALQRAPRHSCNMTPWWEGWGWYKRVTAIWPPDQCSKAIHMTS